ncbi:SDR family NAD(P)-dependent oxidoreductase [Kaistia terrae]|uniref:SDR family NAD(P)-dependent oxidoreductase n=1 Tax=Kaistia terrae TaxID=537017 RepID=A0ABW0PTT9_9HYPH|nr:SDR family oxidoreductase [Kaistia terrae]MCX5578350.1 SDR family NAD(P)-dependent oxidoreductase [Kaistia terrae]
MDLELSNKTALVTGSTGGIGLAIAKTLAEEGAAVIVTGRSAEKVEQTVREIGAARGVVADPATAEGAAALTSAVPSIDILVNNLGIYEAKPFVEITDADWLHFFDVNVLSGIRLARHYFPAMLERNWGRIIFVSSESSLQVPPDMIHYATTKTAQLTIARGLAELTKGTAVTVNSIMPGPTRSAGIGDFLRSVFPGNPGSEAELEKEFFRLYRSSSLLQRMIDPKEIAALVAYVASPLGAATNGAALRVEGGLLMSVA